jgi:hypothetical protein
VVEKNPMNITIYNIRNSNGKQKLLEDALKGGNNLRYNS